MLKEREGRKTPNQTKPPNQRLFYCLKEMISDEYAADLFNLLCGSEIGSGVYRTVYQCNMNPDWVVKKDTGENFSNIFEYQIYHEYEGTKLAKWLAPVHWLSQRGLWLMMTKTEPIPQSKLPKKIPAIFADTHPGNWGWLNGRVVCHDYGNNRIFHLAKSGACDMVDADFE